MTVGDRSLEIVLFGNNSILEFRQHVFNFKTGKSSDLPHPPHDVCLCDNSTFRDSTAHSYKSQDNVL
jgi:hypothetical protein